MTNGWCRACDIGYVAALPVPSWAFFEYLDTHGHEVDISKSSCPACPRAMAQDGYCRDSKIGFVEGRGYVTRLTYLVAKAPQAGTELNCTTCLSHLGDEGWCHSCRRGIVGNSLFESPYEYGQAVKEFRRLRAALEKASDCEFCGIALFSSGRCSSCDLHYRGGRVVARDPGFPDRLLSKRR